MSDSHALRGKEYENRINELCHMVNLAGGFALKLQPEKIAANGRVQVTRGEPFDYIIILPEEIHCFDAKTTLSREWYIGQGRLESPLKKQIDSLHRIKAMLGARAHCYFSVWFRKSGCMIRFDIDTVREALDAGTKTLAPHNGDKWNVQNEILVKCPNVQNCAKPITIWKWPERKASGEAQRLATQPPQYLLRQMELLPPLLVDEVIQK